MKKTISVNTLFIFALVLMSIGFGCNKKDESPTPDNRQSTNISANSMVNSSNSTTNTTNSTSSSSNPSLGTSAPKDISGSYSATGTNEGGKGNYAAELVVTNRDDVYQFSWDSKGVKYDGVGVQTDNKVAVSFTDGEDGKGCGVILYKINSDGSLDGKAGYWGMNTKETETAKRNGGSDLAGDYDVDGKNPDGKTYKSKLSVKQSGEGYTFDWTGGATLKGFGIKQGDTVSVGFGGAKCSFVAYEIKSDGTLEGKWGGANSTSFGMETAKKK